LQGFSLTTRKANQENLTQSALRPTENLNH
jgi:hypothetical protein